MGLRNNIAGDLLVQGCAPHNLSRYYCYVRRLGVCLLVRLPWRPLQPAEPARVATRSVGVGL